VARGALAEDHAGAGIHCCVAAVASGEVQIAAAAGAAEPAELVVAGRARGAGLAPGPAGRGAVRPKDEVPPVEPSVPPTPPAPPAPRVTVSDAPSDAAAILFSE
jgi:hypothetical protein